MHFTAIFTGKPLLIYDNNTRELGGGKAMRHEDEGGK